jgi:hypothetical protein
VSAVSTEYRCSESPATKRLLAHMIMMRRFLEEFCLKLDDDDNDY